LPEVPQRTSGKFVDAEEYVVRILSLPCVGRDMDSEEVPMRKVVASEIISLDGVVESPENWSFQFHNDQMEEAIGEAMAASDAMLLGRVTYEGFAAFWPSQGADEDQRFAGYRNNTPNT
jgi:RibD C-terminal domain